MSTRTRLGALAAAAAATVLLAACGSDAAGDDTVAVSDDGTRTVKVGALSNGVADERSIEVTPDEDAIALLPKDIKDAGELVIGIGALPAGYPPLAFVGDDEKTLTGSEPDLGRLIAATLGLDAKVENASWENLFVRIGSGQFDVGFSNITVTEERKETYDFATYRKDQLAFTVLDSNDWEFTGDYRELDGQKVGVGPGTNQEAILLGWNDQLKAEGGKGIDIGIYQDTNSYLLAIQSGRIDSYFGPNPGAAYLVKENEGKENPVRVAGTFSGAGADLQGLIAATTKKGNDLAPALEAAIDSLIESGQYAEWLETWGLQAEDVGDSELNPAGLPKN